MSYEEIRRIQKLLKQVRDLRDMVRGFGGRSKDERRNIVTSWLSEHSTELPQVPPKQLNDLREAAEYDEVEWARLLQALKGPGNDDRQDQ
jgi:hypothetical protein